LENLITKKKAEMKAAEEQIIIEKLYTEIQALDRLYSIVCSYDA
jgi:hypothetical protein